MHTKGDRRPSVDKAKLSMAASAAYIPGASLSDKLRLAASKGDVAKVHELIHSGAHQDADREGRTALHYAALNGHGEIVQILGDEGADINSKDRLGYTALHRAAAQGHLEVIKVLLSEACLVSQQDEVHGNSPLHEAAWNGYSRTLELLVKHKANVHCINKAGFSSLHLAAQNGHNQSARVLLYAGCNPDLKNNYGDSALHTAARYGHVGVSRILISAHCNISQQNKNGDTALHISAALRRRKLSKLLTESAINTSLKNKQNETAADVARRKDHADIVVIITSQSKSKKKKKGKDKEKKEKSSSQNSSEEKPEKKGLFFKKKIKTKKEQNKENIPEEPAPRVVVDHHSAPSEISSSEYTHQMAPEDLLRGFRHTMTAKTRERHQGSTVACGTSTRGPRSGPRKPVTGLLSDYAPKQGTQYYKDLAGNLKQGPIGYAPVCNCRPVIKKLEKKMEHDRTNIYDHIDASHKMLSSKIDLVDKRSTHQVHSLDKLSKERFEEERREREKYVHACLDKDRMEMRDNCDGRHGAMKTELENHVDNRISRFENYYATRPVVNMDPCYWCHGNENTATPHYHQDDMLNQKYMHYEPEEPPPPGKLYKSKSDETLSVASSHHSRKYWKLRSDANNARDVTDLKLASVIEKARRMEHKIRSQSSGVRLRESRQTARQVDRDYYSYKDYVDQQRNTRHKSGDGRPSRMVRDSSRDGLNEHNAGNDQTQFRRQRSALQLNDAHMAQKHAFNTGQNQRRSCADLLDDNHHVVYNKGNRENHGNPVRASNTGTRANFDGARSTSVYNYGTNSQRTQSNVQNTAVGTTAIVHREESHYAQLTNPRETYQKPAVESSAGNGRSAGMARPPRQTSSSQNWTPLHTSSPEQQAYASPDTSASVMSSQNSTPIFPSPSYPPSQTSANQRSESSSNPDSGYGSRLFGARQVSGPQITSSTSSFQSSHGHNSSLAVSATSNPERATSPIMQYAREPRSLSTHVRNGYGPETTGCEQQHTLPRQGAGRFYNGRSQGSQPQTDNNMYAKSPQRPSRSSSQPPSQQHRPIHSYPQNFEQSANVIGKATQV